MKEEINKQLKINEVEFTLHSQPSYLKKLQKIYFDTNDIDSFENTRINLIDFEKQVRSDPKITNVRVDMQS